MTKRPRLFYKISHRSVRNDIPNLHTRESLYRRSTSYDPILIVHYVHHIDECTSQQKHTLQCTVLLPEVDESYGYISQVGSTSG